MWSTSSSAHDAQQWAPRDCMSPPSSSPPSAAFCNLASTWPIQGAASCSLFVYEYTKRNGTFFISLAQVICPTITLSASLTLLSSLSLFRSLFFVICICSAYLRLQVVLHLVGFVFCLFSWRRHRLQDSRIVFPPIEMWTGELGFLLWQDQ